MVLVLLLVLAALTVSTYQNRMNVQHQNLCQKEHRLASLALALSGSAIVALLVLAVVGRLN